MDWTAIKAIVRDMQSCALTENKLALLARLDYLADLCGRELRPSEPLTVMSKAEFLDKIERIASDDREGPEWNR